MHTKCLQTVGLHEYADACKCTPICRQQNALVYALTFTHENKTKKKENTCTTWVFMNIRREVLFFYYLLSSFFSAFGLLFSLSLLKSCQ